MASGFLAGHLGSLQQKDPLLAQPPPSPLLGLSLGAQARVRKEQLSLTYCEKCTGTSPLDNECFNTEDQSHLQ